MYATHTSYTSNMMCCTSNVEAETNWIEQWINWIYRVREQFVKTCDKGKDGCKETKRDTKGGHDG